MSNPTYASVCSGVEAATVAWHPLGWKPVLFSEIDKFPSEVLAHRFPSVPNLGDMTKVNWDEQPDFDVLIGGTPCQSFSVAGLRKGLADPRGNLALEFLRIVDRKRPRWFVWENVPGVLSSDGGRDFGSFLGAVVKLGYGFAYRVLDAQHFGVPQRRRRVFVVGHSGGWTGPAAVLLERESLRGDSAPSREKGQGVAALTAAGVGTCGADDNQAQAGHLITHPLTARHDSSEDGTGRGLPLVMAHGQAGAECVSDGSPSLTCNHEAPICFNWQNGGGYGNANIGLGITEDGSGPLSRSQVQAVSCFPLDLRNAGRDPEKFDEVNRQGVGVGENGDPAHTCSTACVHGVAHNATVRRLTPIECERLQGFPEIEKRATIWVKGTHPEQSSTESAKSVGPGSPASRQDSAPPVLASVHIDYERSAVVELRTASGSWSASGAGERNECRQLTSLADSAVALAGMLSIWGTEVPGGRAASPSTRRRSSVLAGGRCCVEISGQEIAGFVSGAAPTTQNTDRSTTSKHTQSTPAKDLTPKTLSCCVASVIAGFIQEKTKMESSWGIEIVSRCGFTRIPWRGKPAEECPDSHRYKAMGNSMAVPVIRWLGERIEMVDEILTKEASNADES